MQKCRKTKLNRKHIGSKSIGNSWINLSRRTKSNIEYPIDKI
jgi:hypothetical protein